MIFLKRNQFKDLLIVIIRVLSYHEINKNIFNDENSGNIKIV